MTVSQLENLVTLLRSRPTPAVPDVVEARTRFEKMGVFLGGAPDAKCEKVDAGGVPAEWVAAPGIDAGRAVLYLHGGGYAIGSLNTHRRLAYDISAASGARVLLVDYRLAPEHPFPAAVDDATKAWQWLKQQGFADSKLAIAGDSAGGGLTLAALVNLRDRQLGLPACAAALSPWVDMEGLGNSITARSAQDPMVQKDGLLWMARMYLNGADARSPLAAPLHAADPDPGRYRRDPARRRHAHRREAARRRRRGEPLDLAEHAARLPAVRAHPVRRPRRLSGDRQFHPRPSRLRETS
jgi:monoterpene epsilon-lactone hydrolase